MSKRFRHGFSDTKRKVLNPTEPSVKKGMERLTLFRMFKEKDEHPDEILKYDFSILHCKARLHPIFALHTPF